MTTKTKSSPQKRQHLLTEKRIALAASALAQKIGYLNVHEFSATSIFDSLPIRPYSANRVIRSNDELLIVKGGSVEIWHTRYDRLVKELSEGAMFGEMPLLGQTLLGTRAITGTEGATVAVMNLEAAKRWIRSEPVAIFEKLGPRLAEIDARHYGSQFQLVDSRIAAELLELAGEGSVIEGLTHEEIGLRVGSYRETVTSILSAMKAGRLIEIGRKKITLLDKRRLQELAEL